MAKTLPLFIVEGHRDMITLLQRFFARRQIDVEGVTSVADAMTYLAQRPVRIVLTDLFLPHGDGLMLVQHVRQAMPHIRVVVMGTFQAPEVAQNAIEAGAYAFLNKPFTLECLWGVVQQALQDD